MAKKTSTKTPSQTRTAAASKPGKPSSKVSAGAAFAKRTASSITGDIRSLAAEVKDLRSLRAKYDQLLVEHHGLVGALRELSTELAGSARSAWKQYRAGGKGGKSGMTSMTSMTSSSTLMGRPRVRAASAEVDAMTAKLLASLPTAWSTKQEVCRAAGLDPTEANSAFRRLVLGYTRGGKKIHAAIETNGKRGIEGRYRKA
ncbi:MAG: hypothetical protein NT059_02560 [Planctomycetota bacterium]|nr:hypothetical protein [Planctomycetota bacterium]